MSSLATFPTVEQFAAERRRRSADAERKRLANDADLIRERCQNLVGFVRDGWPVLEPTTPYVHGWYIDAIAEHLQAVTVGQILRLLINISPGSLKSLLVSVFWPAWEWGPAGRPSMRYLATSYEQDLVMRDNLRMRRLVESEWYQALWPLPLAEDQRAKGKFENEKTGVREGRAFISMTGGRGDRVIIDDPHSVKTAESETQRKDTVQTFREAIPSRVNSDQSAIVVIMQRLHANDISGTILREDLGYDHLMIPMEFERDHPHPSHTSIRWIDPRRHDGDLMSPERTDRAALEKMKKVLGQYAYAGQFQQRPSPREGGLFKREWFEGKIAPAAPRGTVWVRGWDLAATKKNTSSRTSGVKLGFAPDKSYWVGHCIATQKEGHKVRKVVKGIAETDGPLVEISIPQDPGAAGKVVARDYVVMLPGYIVRTSPESGDKVTRAEPFSVQCEAGNVYLVEGEWNADYLDELCLFPGGHFKDRVDATSRAFELLAKKAQREGAGGFAAPEIIMG